jgi:hypothetical protein
MTDTHADDREHDEHASGQIDLSTDSNDDLIDPETLTAVARRLEHAPETDMMCHANDLLAEHVAALKRLENAAEDARKNGYEQTLSKRVNDDDEALREALDHDEYIADASYTYYRRQG